MSVAESLSVTSPSFAVMAAYWAKIWAKKQARPVSINNVLRVVIFVGLDFVVFVIVILIVKAPFPCL